MTLGSFTDDVSLMARIAAQDQAALSQLYDRYARVVAAIAHRSLQSNEECEEVVLDVFSQVWRSAAQYNPQKGRVDTWLFMMARSRVLDRLRSLQRLTKTATASVQAEIQSVKVSVDPVEAVFISERRSQVICALKQLPKEQREVIELAYYQGLSHREIAAQTGLSLGTVKTRIRLGLSKLQSSLNSWRTS
jgi:RNA polymerase sigma-70 factor (ECF subfamily)